MEKGKLIVLEGSCDGIGKTTQFKLLGSHLKEEGEHIITHHFPSYKTYQAIPIEKYLNGEYGTPDSLSPYFINSLYAIDRAIIWNTKLKKEYIKNNMILLDRYTTSSLIYQSALIENIQQKKEFIDYVCDFEYNKLQIPKPDKIIFLEAPFEVITKLRNERKQNEGLTNDIHESNLDFMKKVYDNAMFLADYLNWNQINCAKNNQMKSIEEIHEEIYKLVRKK